MSGTYRCLSGRRFDDAACLGYLGPERSCVVLTAPGTPGGPPVRLAARLVVPTLLTGLWRSHEGRVWVTDRDGVVRWCDDPWADEAQWAQQELDLVFRGIAGAGDGTVWAWGTRRSDGAGLVRRYDTKAWRAVTAPGFAVRAVSASAAGVWLAGADGWVARYDTDRWTVVSVGREVPLTSVCVDPADPERVFVGAEDGNVYAGGVHGFEPFAGVPAPVHAVAHWRDRLWVGAGGAGLYAGQRGPLPVVRADRHCRSLAVGDHLMVGCDEVICSSPDGEAFPATGRGFVAAAPGA